MLVTGRVKMSVLKVRNGAFTSDVGASVNLARAQVGVGQGIAM